MRAIEKFDKIVVTVLSMSGIVPGHMTFGRIFLLLISVIFSPLIFPKHDSPSYAFLYYVITTVCYMAFIFFALTKYGAKWRRRLIRNHGEEKAFVYFETILVIIFFHNTASLSFLSQSTSSSFSLGDMPTLIIRILGVLLYLFSNTISIWSAQILSIPLYYWKDMFLDKSINTFVASGPYKYFKNPLYGVGRLQYYGIALAYCSLYGLLAAFISQVLLYLFYYTVESPFVKRFYY